ncbi:helix-turn-helix transcriptional regulator [Pseudonocardia sp. TRM90224]|uniref:helix-turn-helix transcriptional regulator n=1 Tax=Pseudonocardia sp. TRM90224 TaxID=2812678 RepID=UPI001E567586|nr:LuxR C-terminal-related transcriptional regulator [Pseudonocardia sp. TRM90224]
MLLADRDSLVGRTGELTDLTGLLTGRVQLVTVTGPGGVGKTRVATRVAHDLRHHQRFPDGVVLVDLRGVDNPEWIPDRIVQDAGMHTVSAVDSMTLLQQRLRDAQLLLVLDNCEQVAADVGDVIGVLLDSCPGVRVLATSRTTLELPGEHQYPLLPLAAPHPDSPEFDENPLPEALVLFADRAAAVDPGFDLQDNRIAVARICHRLGGFPLLIEIITSKLRMFSVPQLEQRLDNVFGARWSTVTRTGYRTTFCGVMDLSWNLCSPAERLVWQRLSVFAGGVTLEAAEAVVSDTAPDTGSDGVAAEDVELILDGLIRQSLLTRDAASRRPRFRVLEPIRQVGADALTAAGEQDLVRERHSAWCARFLAEAAEHWCGPEEVAWLDAVHAELPNVRAAMDWCASSGDTERGIRIGADLIRVRVPFRDGTLQEWRSHLQRMVELHPRRDRVLLLGLTQCAWVAVCQGSAEATDLLDRARDVERELEGGASAATVDPHLAYAETAYATFVLGDPAAADLAARARRLMRASGAEGDACMATMWWAIASSLFADPAVSDEATRTHLEEATGRQGAWHLSWAQWTRAVHLLLRKGEIEPAGELLHQSLPVQREIGDYWGPIWWVAFASWLASARGDHLRAAELCGATERVMELTGIMLNNLRGNGDQHQRCLQLASEALGEPLCKAAYRRGLAVPDYGTAIALALGEISLTDGPAGSEPHVARNVLTPREYEVALLVGQRTNDEIAAALQVSVTTVKTHVTQILQKLGCRRRRQVPDALQRLGLGR